MKRPSVRGEPRDESEKINSLDRECAILLLLNTLAHSNVSDSQNGPLYCEESIFIASRNRLANLLVVIVIVVYILLRMSLSIRAFIIGSRRMKMVKIQYLIERNVQVSISDEVQQYSPHHTDRRSCVV